MHSSKLYRHKDRTSPTTRLEPHEALKFERALYRYWLYCATAGRDAFLPDDDEYDDVDEEDIEERDQKLVRLGLIDMISSLSTEEVFELHHIGNFCEEASRWQRSTYRSSCEYSRRLIRKLLGTDYASRLRLSYNLFISWSVSR